MLQPSWRARFGDSRAVPDAQATANSGNALFTPAGTPTLVERQQVGVSSAQVLRLSRCPHSHSPSTAVEALFRGKPVELGRGS